LLDARCCSGLITLTFIPWRKGAFWAVPCLHGKTHDITAKPRKKCLDALQLARIHLRLSSHCAGRPFPGSGPWHSSSRDGYDAFVVIFLRLVEAVLSAASRALHHLQFPLGRADYKNPAGSRALVAHSGRHCQPSGAGVFQIFRFSALDPRAAQPRLAERAAGIVIHHLRPDCFSR